MPKLSVATAVAAALATVGWSPPALAQMLQVSGYADLEATLGNIDSDDAEFSLDNHHFNIIVLGKLTDALFAAAEVEFEHGGEEVALEYGYITYTGVKNLRISAGKFIVPFGRFNKDLHPTWINKVPDRPHGFSNILPQTYSDVGIWLSGGTPAGAGGARLTYDLFVVNGLLGEDGGDIRDMRDNDRDRLTAGGIDDNKAIGGRLGLEFAPQGFDIGASAYFGNYFDDPATNLTLAMFGVDLAYHYEGLEFRAEGVVADQESTAGDLTKKGGYAQLAYLIQSRFEPVVRFSLRDMPGEDQDARRLSIGSSFYVSANAVVRLAYSKNFEDAGFEADNDRVIAQFALSF